MGLMRWARLATHQGGAVRQRRTMGAVAGVRPIVADRAVIAQTSVRSWRGGRAEEIVSCRAPRFIVRALRRSYGHSSLTGRSGLISTGDRAGISGQRRFLPAQRHIAFYGGAPASAADGGFASRDNLAQAKALGVQTWPFTKKPACASRTWSKATGSVKAAQLPGRHQSTSRA